MRSPFKYLFTSQPDSACRRHLSVWACLAPTDYAMCCSLWRRVWVWRNKKENREWGK